MKVRLMHSRADFEIDAPLPANVDDLIDDLELDRLLGTMAAGDTFLFDVARTGLFTGPTDPDEIRYRQDIVQDCLGHAHVARGIYALAVEALEGERKIYRSILHHPSYAVSRSVEVLQLFVDVLHRLRDIADHEGPGFRSRGFTTLFATLQEQLDDAYFATVEAHLKRLRFQGGILVSADLGRGNKGSHYTLRMPADDDRHWFEKLFGLHHSTFTITIPERDQAGFSALTELKDRGLNDVANALSQSTDHILSFFDLLRCELGFYLGCLNLHDALDQAQRPTCFPQVQGEGQVGFSCRGLYDVCLALSIDGPVVGNDVDASGKHLVMITGANQGGKSTFLRSLGLAQLMMQSGMFVAAETFTAPVTSGLFTHYKREEDKSMSSGKLDEELNRMSTIVDQLSPGCLVLCNESFAATNEREGSQIARQILRALLESGVRVLYVTHLYDLAHGLHQQGNDHALFLRAERREDGQRTYRLVAGEPLPTSFGQDVYQRIFSAPPNGRQTADLRGDVVQGGGVQPGPSP
ncbi:MutS-related protein [Segeticoccus rhizosphaerae]|uniref:MutS-related protein n=1 Tax=Segeticoccus rhizosphaerae TaxID=1104777 RepID=UPI0010C059CE|nr:DNA mismatch repair protein MutS [Ornithinicoccus soli]